MWDPSPVSVHPCPVCASKGDLNILTLPTPKPSYAALANMVEHYRGERNRWRDRAKEKGWTVADVEAEIQARETPA